MLRLDFYPAAYELDGFSAEDNFTSDREFAGGVNLRLPLNPGATSPAFFKAGAKVRAKTKRQDINTTEFATEATLGLTGLADAAFDHGDFLDGRYRPGVHVDPAAARALRDRPDCRERIRSRDRRIGLRRERAGVAAYAMTEL